jgi:hypothetical protein
VCVCLCAKMCLCDQVYVRISTVVTRTHALLRDLLPFVQVWILSFCRDIQSVLCYIICMC